MIPVFTVLAIFVSILRISECVNLSCLKDASIDLVFALDSSMNMQRHKDNIRFELPHLMARFKNQFSKSRMGLVTFNDEGSKCIKSFKHDRNFAPRVELPLTDKLHKLIEVIQRYDPTNGDLLRPQDSMGALLVAAKNHRMGWLDKTATAKSHKETEDDTEDKHLHFKVVVVVTDATYRKPGDISDLCNDKPSKRFKPNYGDGNYHFSHKGYPSTSQITSTLHQENIMPIFLTLDNNRELNVHPVYETLLATMTVGGAPIKGKAVPAKDGRNLGRVVTSAIGSAICDQKEEKPTKPRRKELAIVEDEEEETVGTTEEEIEETKEDKTHLTEKKEILGIVEDENENEEETMGTTGEEFEETKEDKTHLRAKEEELGIVEEEEETVATTEEGHETTKTTTAGGAKYSGVVVGIASVAGVTAIVGLVAGAIKYFSKTEGKPVYIQSTTEDVGLYDDQYAKEVIGTVEGFM